MTATAPDKGLTLKVTVGDTWQPLVLAVAPAESVHAVKLRALASQKIPAERASGYEVKLGGAVVRDESGSVAAAGARDGSALIVLSKRRRPVR